MKLLNFHNDETVAKKFGVLNADVADVTVADYDDHSNSDLSSTSDTVTKSRKTKITSPGLSPDNPNAVSKPHKSNGTDHKASKKLKKSIVEPDIHDSNSGHGDLTFSSDTLSKSRKTKITSPSLSPDNPNAVSKPRKSNDKVSKKSKKSIVDPDIHDSNSSRSDLSSDTVSKFRKTKITSPGLSPDNPNVISKPSKSDGTDHKISKKLKQAVVEPEPSASKVKSSVKSKHLKNKD